VSLRKEGLWYNRYKLQIKNKTSIEFCGIHYILTSSENSSSLKNGRLIKSLTVTI